MKKAPFILTTAAIAVFALAGVAQAETGHVRARGANGVVAGGTHNGNSYVRGRGHTTNDDGSRTTASGSAFRLNNGATGARQSSTDWGGDGSVSHQGSASTSGPRGSASTSGGFTRDADGNTSGSRNSSVTNGKTGNSYDGSTSYNSNDGWSHNGTCHDASGAEIACPSR